MIVQPVPLFDSALQWDVCYPINRHLLKAVIIILFNRDSGIIPRKERFLPLRFLSLISNVVMCPRFEEPYYGRNSGKPWRWPSRRFRLLLQHLHVYMYTLKQRRRLWGFRSGTRFPSNWEMSCIHQLLTTLAPIFWFAPSSPYIFEKSRGLYASALKRQRYQIRSISRSTVS